MTFAAAVIETAYILGIDPKNPGPDFNDKPSVFKRYCKMQSDYARASGHEEQADEMMRNVKCPT